VPPISRGAKALPRRLLILAQKRTSLTLAPPFIKLAARGDLRGETVRTRLPSWKIGRTGGRLWSWPVAGLH